MCVAALDFTDFNSETAVNAFALGYVGKFQAMDSTCGPLSPICLTMGSKDYASSDYASVGQGEFVERCDFGMV